MLLVDASRAYILYLVERKNATKSTTETYRRICFAFVGDLEIDTTDNLTILVVDTYADKLAKQNISVNTLRNKLSIIRCFVRWLYSRDLVSFRPELIELPKAEAIEANFLTEIESIELLSCIKKIRDRAMIHFLLTTGLRVNELLEVRLQDVYERSVVVRCGKGRKPRVTYITPDCESDVKKYLRKRGRYDGYLFDNNRACKMSKTIVARKVKYYSAMAGIKKIVTPHTLRHTFATTMLRNGARVEDVQQLLGHANIRTTMLYLHFTNEYLASRYDKFMLHSKE